MTSQPFRQVLIAVLCAALLCCVPGFIRSAYAQSAFSVTVSGNTFTVTRTESGTVETVHYSTYNDSALDGVHYTGVEGALTFSENETSKTLTVEETPADRLPEQYHYQTGTTRQYGLSVQDEDGFTLASAVRVINYGTSWQVPSACIHNAGLTDLLYLSGSSGDSVDFATGLDESQYFDMHHNSLNWEKVTDAGYNQAVYSVGAQGIYTKTNVPRDYMEMIDGRIYAAVGFTMKESYDGYQYIQILDDTPEICDENDPGGWVYTPEISLYKACFELSGAESGEDVDKTEQKQFFPHRYEYQNRDYGGQSSTWTEFPTDDAVLHEQQFREYYFRAGNTGAVILPLSTERLYVRFDASGNGKDDWYFDDLFARFALVDDTAPTLVGQPVVSRGPNRRQNNVTVSLSFNEIVNASGTTLETTWGDLSCTQGGNKSNVVTYSGVISAQAGTQLQIRDLDGTIRDLAGNPFTGSAAATLDQTVAQSPAYSITYNLDGGFVSGNPTSYTYFTSPITLNNPTKPYYDFTGWDGTGQSSLTKNLTIPTGSQGSREYQAHFQPSMYHITYDLNNGEGDPANPTEYNILDSFELINPTRSGYEFAGWTGTDLTGMTKTVVIPKGSHGDRSYKAHWQSGRYLNMEDGAYVERDIPADTPSLGPNDTAWWSNWLVVDGNVTIGDRVTLKNNVNLVLSDNAELTLMKGITVPGDKSLTIFVQSTGAEMGRLVAHAEDYHASIGGYSVYGEHAGSYACGTITIAGGNITAIGGDGAAGIGSCPDAAGGTIIIKGGVVNAIGGRNGAAIGGGVSSRGGTIVIEGGWVKAQGGLNAAGIGGGHSGGGGAITITGGSVNAKSDENGAGIGGGANGGGGTIVIVGGRVTAEGGINAAGIGGGTNGGGGRITISDGNIIASGGDGGAGIGGGANRSGGTIAITGGTVSASAGLNAAGIGGGKNGSGGSITIGGDAVIREAKGGNGSSGGDGGDNWGYIIGGYPDEPIKFDSDVTVELTYEYGGAGIGGGAMGEGGIITVGGDAVIKEAVGGNTGGGSGAAGIGGGANADGGTITITGGTILNTCAGLNGAGIGGGAKGSGGCITISGGSINATGDRYSDVEYGGGAAIGGGRGGDGGIITIGGSDTVIEVSGGRFAAGIGGGAHGSAGNITISGGSVTSHGYYHNAAAGCYGAAIGGGYYGDGGNITISGGTISAWGGDEGPFGVCSRGSAGIGSGYHGEAGTITIHGGAIEARGGLYAAAIGGSYRNGTEPSTGGTIIIDGGTIEARGGAFGAGIGGGYCCSGGSITISGGTINAYSILCGAGIGGGCAGKGGEIAITGGNIESAAGGDGWTGYYGGAGIGGGGDLSNHHAGSGGTITITGGTITAHGGATGPAVDGGVAAAGIGNGGYFGDIDNGVVILDWAFTADSSAPEVPCVYADSFTGFVTLEKPFADRLNADALFMPGEYTDPEALSGARLIPCSMFAPPFGQAALTMPADLTEIEEEAFAGSPLVTTVDAGHCKSIGAGAFRGCTDLAQIRLPKICAIDDTAFDGCGKVVIYAPAGGSTEEWCNSHPDCLFIMEERE